jgi:hypothetical protein
MSGTPPSGYHLMDVERVLAEDERTCELQIHLAATEQGIVVGGRVASEQRRDEVLAIVREQCPGCTLVDELGIDADTLAQVPAGSEEIK